MGFTYDDLTELRVEVEDIRRQLVEAESHVGGLRHRLGIVGFRLGELARANVAPTHTGMLCAAELSINIPEVSTHDVAPDDGIPFALRDEPPSHPPKAA